MALSFKLYLILVNMKLRSLMRQVAPDWTAQLWTVFTVTAEAPWRL